MGGGAKVGGGPGGGGGASRGPEDDADPDGASRPPQVELPGRGSPWVHALFGTGGGAGFASVFFGASPPAFEARPPAAAPFFGGVEAIGSAQATDTRAPLDGRAKARGQREAARRNS